MSPLYDELIELDRVVRDERLRALACDDADLARGLTAMFGLAQNAKDDAFLDSRLHVDVVATLGMRGRRIGPYAIEEELGQGGSGSVWKASPTVRNHEGHVAIKLLHLSLLRPADVARFRKEGTVLARLSHPNIVRLLDSGVTLQGQPYLVLEHVDGIPIDQYCDQHRFGLHARLRMLNTVMAAIHHAHSQRVVHRDIKPSNILVAEPGRIKLLDFGIAKLLEEESGHAALIPEGRHAFTPRYAAPEQLEGGPVSAGTDVYALGVLMYRLLVEAYPTCAEDANAAQVVAGTLSTEPPPLHSALERLADPAARRIADRRGTPLTSLQSQLKGLDPIIRRALHKQPGQRYASVAAFAADIARFLDGQPVLARAGLWSPDACAPAHATRKNAWAHRLMKAA